LNGREQSEEDGKEDICTEVWEVAIDCLTDGTIWRDGNAVTVRHVFEATFVDVSEERV